MFGKMPERQPDRAGESDKRLSSLLQEWRPVEPSPAFSTAVWRRIRPDSMPEPKGLPALFLLLDKFLPQRAWVAAAAVAVAVIMGVWAGLPSPAERESHWISEPLLQPQTLTGAYLAMTTGDYQ